MPTLPLPFHSYNLPSRVPSRLVNCYAQQTLGKGPVELMSPPGISTLASLGNGPGRGMFVQKNVLYAVSGTSLYSITQNGTATNLGTVPGSDRLTITGNGTEIVTSNGYYYNGSTVAAIGDADLPSLEAVDFLSGYILGVESGSGRFVGSALNDATSWAALDFATAEGSPDNLITLIVDHLQALLFGEESTEIWWLAGGSGFPFARTASGFIELGIAAKHGVTKIDNSVFWLASDGTVRRLNGQTPVRVSQHGVEEKIASYASVSDCVAFSWTWGGHLFVAFRFPSAGACWVFDITTGEWHERSTYSENDWLVTDMAHCYGHVYAQHATTGAIGQLEDDVYTEFGGILRREWTFPQVYGNNRRLFHSNLEIIMRTGDAPIGTTPYVHLDISNDGGNTWAALPRREIGNVGEYAQRIIWQRLGSARDRVYRMYVSDAVPMRVLSAELTVS